jgi:hypothetical protein
MQIKGSMMAAKKSQVRKDRIAIFFHNIIPIGRAHQIRYVPVKVMPAFVDPLSKRRKRNHGNSFLTHQISPFPALFLPFNLSITDTCPCASLFSIYDIPR